MVFFSERVSIYGTNYLFQPILDPYEYLCIVSAVWIYPVIYIYNFSMYVCIFSVSCVLCLMVLYVFAQWYFVGPLLVHVMPCCPVIVQSYDE